MSEGRSKEDINRDIADEAERRDDAEPGSDDRETAINRIEELLEELGYETGSPNAEEGEG
jgi:hypothetical protein